MIYKVFYQETKERNPRREQTKSLYLDIDAEKVGKCSFLGNSDLCYNRKA